VKGRLKVGDQGLPLGPVRRTGVEQFGEPHSFDLLALMKEWVEIERGAFGLGRPLSPPAMGRGST